MPKILVTGKINDEGLVRLQQEPGFDVDIRPHLPRPEIDQIIGEYDAIVTRSETPIDAAFFANAKNLKLIARGGAGVDNIDIDAATENGVFVCNTPDSNTIAATEQTFALMLALCRNTFQACHNLKNEHQWHRTQFTGNELYHKTLGIVGLGRIGSRVAKRALAFEMRVLAYDPYISPRKAELLGVELVDSLEQLLPQLDILTVHTPKTSETIGMIQAAEIALMKPTARIINCARGGIIDETVLYEALRDKRLAGAALDVFAKEPVTEHPFFELDNIVLTPHLGASTLEAQVNVGLQLAEQVVGILGGKQYENILNLPLADSGSLARLKPFLAIADGLGRCARALGAADPIEISLELFGETASAGEMLERSFLQGYLGEMEGVNVTYANVPLLTGKRGIVSNNKVLNDGGGYDNLIRATLQFGDGTTLSLAGAQVEGENRLVQLSGIDVEARLSGTLLVLYNEDKPGVIGAVGTLLGEKGINIAEWRLGREKAGGDAIAVVRIDQLADETAIDKLRSLPHIRQVTQVVLEGE